MGFAAVSRLSKLHFWYTGERGECCTPRWGTLPNARSIVNPVGETAQVVVLAASSWHTVARCVPCFKKTDSTRLENSEILVGGNRCTMGCRNM